MESVLGRYRNLTILVGVLFLQILGLAVQVKRSGDAENTRLIRIWAVGAITPFERGLVWAHNGSRNLWHNYFFLRGVRAENRELKAQIEQMHLEQVRLSEDAAQAHRLQQLLAFKEQYIAKTVAAQVIGSSGSDLSRSIYIDKGSNDGIAADMAVITAGGIVGKVLLQGVLHGTANGEVVLERVMSDEQVAPGETVLSSGGDQIFPKGLPVGTVSIVSPGRELFLNIQVKPAADLSRLEEVLVVTQKRERQAVAESPAKVRAADILAQRLPSVPDKPADAGTVKSANGAASTSAPGSNGGAKLQTGAVPKPQTESGSGAATKLSPSTATASNVGAIDATHKSTGVAPLAAGETSKKILAKTPSDSTTSGNSGAPQSKPVTQPLSQPPAADDNPH
jgi:rod shape-determining protein MreC